MSYHAPLIVLTLLALPAPALAHIVITSPTPRVDSDSIKEAAAPCGGPRGDTIHQLDGGQMLTIEYDETVAHPGHFELNFSMAGDADWVAMDDNIPDQGGQGSYTYTFEVPDVDCDDCTFQFVQVMTDRNPPTNYYACLDVEITSAPLNNVFTPDAGDGGTADMGSLPDPEDMGTEPRPNNTNANNTSGANNDTTSPNANPGPTPPNPGPDAGSEADGGVQNVNGSGTACATLSDHPAPNNPIGWVLLGGLILLRRRRRSSLGSTAAR